MGKAIYLLVFWVILPTSSFYTLYGQGNLFAGVLSDFAYFFFLHFLCARQSICWCFGWFCLLLLFTLFMRKAIYWHWCCIYHIDLLFLFDSILEWDNLFADGMSLVQLFHSIARLYTVSGARSSIDSYVYSLSVSEWDILVASLEVILFMQHQNKFFAGIV